MIVCQKRRQTSGDGKGLNDETGRRLGSARSFYHYHQHDYYTCVCDVDDLLQ